MKYKVKTKLWGWIEFDLPDWFEHGDVINSGYDETFIVYDPWLNRVLRNIFGEDSFPKKLIKP